MAIVEQGVGVLLQPRDKCRVAVGRTPITQGLLKGTFFDSAALGNGVRLYVFPRLWTSATDPTDPGLEYGKDWIFGYNWNSEGVASVFGSPTSIELAGRIALPTTPALGNEVFDNAVDLPIPGYEYDISAQGVGAWLAMQIMIQSSALQTAVAVVQLRLVTSWSGT